MGKGWVETVLLTPQWTAVANAIISLCYLIIGGLILTGLIRERRLGFNPLGTATVFIFLTCAAGHAVHVEHYLAFSNIYNGVDDLWHQLLVDGLTIIPAVAYLAQRRRYGLVIRGPHALLDFQRRLAVAEALREISQDIAAQTDLDALLERVIRHARRLLGADYVAVMIGDESGEKQRQALGMLTKGWDEPAWGRAMFVSGTSVAGSVVDSQQPIVIADLRELSSAARQEYVVHLAEGARSLLAVPITRGNETIGSLVVAYRSVRRLGEEDIAGVMALASQTVVAVENARLIATLRQADRLKDEFLSAAAHELKTPVTTIKGYAELLLGVDQQGERERKALQSILRQSERITRLTEDLLAVISLESTSPALRAERFDLSTLTVNLVDQTGRMADQWRIQATAPEPLFVEADRQLICEVLRRLLENAVRYSPAGGLIEVSARRAQEEAVVSVRDYGVGIPLDRQPHIFEPFYEPVPSGEPGYIGLVSLGLHVSKRIIAAHGGRLWFASLPGEGSTFSFSLPLSSR